MDFFERFSKEVMEPFAIKTIAASFDSNYNMYLSPSNSDNFDFISPSGDCAVEITTVIPKNEMNMYVYEKLKANGKENLDCSQIKGLKFKDNGDIYSYYGGSISEIVNAINKSIKAKQNKALNRIKNQSYKYIDLAICMVDGSLFDLFSFELNFKDLNSEPFHNIFFITPSHFIRYNNDIGFIEYPRKTA